MHRTNARFWDCFNQLPQSIQILAKKNFELLKNDLNHPSLSFKKVEKFWSARVGINYRALVRRVVVIPPGGEVIAAPAF